MAAAKKKASSKAASKQATAKGKAASSKAASKKATAKAKAEVKSLGQSGSNKILYNLSKLDKGGRPYPLAHYKSLRGWAAKRDFAQKLELDPELSWLSAAEQEPLGSREMLNPN